METGRWRLLDTGPRSAAENMAIDEVNLQARAMRLAPNTVRLLQFDPHTVLVGYHQSVEQEVRMPFCEEWGIDVNRRITGGGAIYFGPNTLGWEIIASKADLRGKIPQFVNQGTFENLCQGIIRALQRLGVSASYRPKNDIEVGGRKISGTGGTERDEAFLFQGTLLVDFDVDTMLHALRIPVMKLKDKEVEEVKERVTCLRWELGRAPSAEEIKGAIARGFEETLGIELTPGGLSEAEETMLQDVLGYFQSEDWIHMLRRPLKDVAEVKSVTKTSGGLIRVSLVLDRPANAIKMALITGDFFVFPSRAIFDLEARLKGIICSEEEIRGVVWDFFRTSGVMIPGVSPDDLAGLILEAVDKTEYEALGVSLSDANHIYAVNGSGGAPPVGRYNVVLLPYCAKAPSCEYRFRDGCSECGGCSYGAAQETVRAAGLRSMTILNFEHLMETLEGLREKGAEGYIGCCCEGFFWKHQDDLESVGLPGVLVDIDDRTCYDLGKEREALVGSFESQTELKINLLSKLLTNVDGRNGWNA